MALTMTTNRWIIQKRQHKPIPLEIGPIHFIGIGGIGMSSIAEILHNLGYQITGSDMAENYVVERLRKNGIRVDIGHKPENVQGASVVVRSTAVKTDNPEVKAALEAQIPVVRRAEMLAELTRLKNTIAIAGSHGKTTTTSLVAAVLQAAAFDPTVINGGIINSIGSNAQLGQGDWLVVEADESDGTFIKIPSTIGVITNIDPEHLDYWGTFNKLLDGFRQFIERMPFYGFAAVCVDDTNVRTLYNTVEDRRLISYGMHSDDADLRAVDIVQSGMESHFNIVLSPRFAQARGVERIEGMKLCVPGKHNILNALSAVIVGLELGIDIDIIKQALAGFNGVKRRFTKTGEVHGITVIDDYGHHPAEIAATLSAARTVAGKNKVIAVMQPHRYTRLSHLFDDFAACFKDADHVIITDVYTAGESPIAGADKDALVKAVKIQGKDAHPLNLNANEDEAAAIARLVKPLVAKGDYIICLGAGSISKWAYALPERL